MSYTSIQKKENKNGSKKQINQKIKSDEYTESKNQLNQEKKTSKSSHRSADYLNVLMSHL